MLSANYSEVKGMLKQKKSELAALEQEKIDIIENEINPFKDQNLREVNEVIKLCEREIEEINSEISKKDFEM